jgi:hypothetical protein
MKGKRNDEMNELIRKAAERGKQPQTAPPALTTEQLERCAELVESLRCTVAEAMAMVREAVASAEKERALLRNATKVRKAAGR